jgi:hypothetical protein
VWGNLKLVGRLIGQKIISSKIVIKCANELLTQDPNDTLIEALTIFLTEVGPAIDTPEWRDYTQLDDIFKTLSGYSKPNSSSLSSRVRFGIVNLLELRAARWLDKRNLQGPAPATISEIRQQATQKPPTAPIHRSSSFQQRPTAATPAAAPAPAPATTRGWNIPAKVKAKSPEEATKAVKSAWKELGTNKDVKAAAAAVRTALDGLSSAELAQVAATEVIAASAEVADKDRGMFMQAIAAVLSGSQAEEALRLFISDIMTELICDIPKLPLIIKDELLPAIAISTEAKEKLQAAMQQQQ